MSQLFNIGNFCIRNMLQNNNYLIFDIELIPLYNCVAMIHMSSAPHDHKHIDADPSVSEDDIELEEIDQQAEDKIKVMRKKLRDAEKENARIREELQRTKADFLNAKRRLEEQSRMQSEREINKLLCEILQIIDSFDMAKSDSDSWTTIDEQWRSGVEGIHAQLLSLLKKYHVEEIEAAGKNFNPELHEALSSEKVSEKKLVNTVVAVQLKGFTRNSTVIRPARVTVGIE